MKAEGATQCRATFGRSVERARDPGGTGSMSRTRTSIDGSDMTSRTVDRSHQNGDWSQSRTLTTDNNGQLSSRSTSMTHQPGERPERSTSSTSMPPASPQ
jgi:hypothetical protein